MRHTLGSEFEGIFSEEWPDELQVCFELRKCYRLTNLCITEQRTMRNDSYYGRTCLQKITIIYFLVSSRSTD